MGAGHALPWRTAIVAAVVLVLAAVPGALAELALPCGAAVLEQPWRLLTAHLVHASWNHALWNALGLVAVGVAVEPALGRRYFPRLAAGALVVSLGLVVLDPALGAYCGLSGLLNTLWVAGNLAAAERAGKDGRRGAAGFHVLCAVACVAKVAIEALGPGPLFTDPARLRAAPVPLAHALGALAGAWGRPSPTLGSLRRRPSERLSAGRAPSA